MNTNIILFPQNDQIGILFAFPKMTKFNIYISFSFPKNDWIRLKILFSLKITFPCGISLLSLFWQRFWHLQHFWRVISSSAKYVYYSGGNPSGIQFEKIRIIFGLKNYPNMNTNNIRFEKITQIPSIFGFKKSPDYEYK